MGLVYADDILLLSHNAMRLMFEVRYKSVAMRIGRRFNVECTPLKLAGVALKYATNRVKYLGVYLVAGTHFECAVDHLKVKFLSCF